MMLALSVCWLVLLVRLCAAAGASRRARNGRPSVGQGIPFAARMLVARSLSTAPHGRLGGTRTLTLRRGLAVVVCSVVATSTAARAHAYDQSPARTTSPKFVATKPAGALVEEGTYVVKTAQGEYVGQSGAISRRLQQHVASGKFTQAEVDAAERAMVTGGKLQREIAEQLVIDSKGGIDGLLNKVNPIGPKRVSVMPNQPYKR